MAQELPEFVEVAHESRELRKPCNLPSGHDVHLIERLKIWVIPSHVLSLTATNAHIEALKPKASLLSDRTYLP
jgi:hypothetical protein